MSQGTRLRFAVTLVLLIPACSPREQSATTTRATSTVAARPAESSGGIGGSVWFSPPSGNDVAVRDFDIQLRSAAKTVAHVLSDGNGIFRFRNVAAGTYQLCWTAQGGWAAGCSPEEVKVDVVQGISLNPVHITPDPAKGGYIWGRVGFADGTAAVAVDPLFAIEKYPQVSVTGGAAVSANSDGEYIDRKER